MRTTATTTLTTYGDLIIHTRGKQHNATGTKLCIPDNVYADDSNIYWCCREDFEKEGPGCVEHFASFGLNMHLGARGKKSKTECLFCSASSAAYADPSTYDGADLSDIDMGNGKSIQVVTNTLPSAPSSVISGNSSCELRARDQPTDRARVWLDGKN
jgi:hypothetical protein